LSFSLLDGWWLKEPFVRHGIIVIGELPNFNGSMTEFMGLISGSYDAKKEGFTPGGGNR
jgi:hypothetical protein